MGNGLTPKIQRYGKSKSILQEGRKRIIRPLHRIKPMDAPSRRRCHLCGNDGGNSDMDSV